MRYVSTRDTSKNPEEYSAAEVIKMGLAKDKGLFFPTSIPAITPYDIATLSKMSYSQRAAEILSRFLDDYDKAALLEDCKSAYSNEKFVGGATKITSLGQVKSLELWHGPTCAFKDMALQIMPRLLSRALKMTSEDKLAHILVATSGDTGKAALEGYKDVPGVKITVFYPVDGVSKMQKRQMTTQEGNNVNVCAVRGNFDDAQNGVKTIFASKELEDKAYDAGFFFSSANSINWGRLAPQIAYYVSAYCDLINSKEIKLGEEVNVCVPTGNFGNILAAYIARKMGIPFNQLICASNSNNVLTDFITTGTYDKTRTFYKTMSPSMDILISSNLERLLYIMAGPSETAKYMAELQETGKYTVSDKLLDQIKKVFKAYYCDEENTTNTIYETFTNKNYLCDTHTAVGLYAANKYIEESGDKRKIILASTASPYKFAQDVCKSLKLDTTGLDDEQILNLLSEKTNTEIPLPLKRALTLDVRFNNVIDPKDMDKVIF